MENNNIKNNIKYEIDHIIYNADGINIIYKNNITNYKNNTKIIINNKTKVENKQNLNEKYNFTHAHC